MTPPHPSHRREPHASSRRTASERIVPSPAAPEPLLPWLLHALRPMSRSAVKSLLHHGCVRINGLAVTQFDHPLTPTDTLTVHSAPSTPVTGPSLTIVFEDESVIVVEKPKGLLSVATEREKNDTAFVRLRSLLDARRAGRPFVVHRLDRETSGLLLFARSVAARDALQAQWDTVVKTYQAVVEGRPALKEGRIENHLLEGQNLKVRVVPADADGQRAVSRYRVLETSTTRSLVEVTLETGRKHQIRVHLAVIGCPVVGDSLYGAKTDPARRLGLHACGLAFSSPHSGQRHEIASPLPAELRRLV